MTSHNRLLTARSCGLALITLTVLTSCDGRASDVVGALGSAVANTATPRAGWQDPQSPSAASSARPAARIERALAAGAGELRPVRLRDGSAVVLAPEGWVVQGEKGMFTARSGRRGAAVSGVLLTTDTATLPGSFPANIERAAAQMGQWFSPQLRPERALHAMAERKGLTGLRILDRSGRGELGAETEQKLGALERSGVACDSGVFAAEFEGADGLRLSGLFSVTTVARGNTWMCGVVGMWAAPEELERALPTLAAISHSHKIDQAWQQRELAERAARHQSLMAQRQASFDAHQRAMASQRAAFDQHNADWREGQRQKDWANHQWSQAFRDQSTWVGTSGVVDTDSWGVNERGGRRTTAWNTSTFDGVHPWTGEVMRKIDYAQWLRLNGYR